MRQRSRDITSIDTALRIYYSKSEIGSEEMLELFGEMCRSSLSLMRKPVLEVMAERGMKSFRQYTVNTEVAYEVWGIDVADLEKRRAKLIKLGLA